MVRSNLYDGGSFLRQLSEREGLGSSSKRWSKKGGPDRSLKYMEGVEMGESGVVLKKRVMVVVDHSSHSKHAMMWALTHVANTGDLLTLLEITSPYSDGSPPHLASSLSILCKASRPEIMFIEDTYVEALVIQGPKLETALSQVKKLEAAVLVIGQKKPSPLSCLIKSSHEVFVEDCINQAGCLTMAVRKQGSGLGGYLISTRWQKNFWLLA